MENLPRVTSSSSAAPYSRAIYHRGNAGPQGSQGAQNLPQSYLMDWLYNYTDPVIDIITNLDLPQRKTHSRLTALALLA